jgi:hypothetical protein
LHPENAGIQLTLGDLRRSSSKSAQTTAKSLASLMRAIKSSMEASLSSQAAKWPLLTPRGQHLTNPYRSDISQVEARVQLDESASEVFEAQHELRGIAFLAGGGTAQDSVNVSGLARPSNAQEWKELVSLSVNATMTTAKTLRVLKRVLASLPVDEDDTDIAGMRAAQLAGAFGGLISELGVAANATASTLRGLLSLAVAAGASARFAPWYVPPESDAALGLTGTDQSPASTPQSSDRKALKTSDFTSSRRQSLDARLAAAKRKPAELAEGFHLPSFPTALTKPRELPMPAATTNSSHLEERPATGVSARDLLEETSTPVKLRRISRPSRENPMLEDDEGDDDEEEGKDGNEAESNKDSPESAKARRARLQQVREFTTPGPEPERRVTMIEAPEIIPQSKPGSSSQSPMFPRVLPGVGRGKTKAANKSWEDPPAPLSSGDKKEKRARGVLKV